MNDFQRDIKNVVSDLVKEYRKGEEENPCGAFYFHENIGIAITLGTGDMCLGDVRIELIEDKKILSESYRLVLVEKADFATQRYYNAFSKRIASIVMQMLAEYYEFDENTFEQEENYV